MTFNHRARQFTPEEQKERVKALLEISAKRLQPLDECCENERDEQYMHDQFRRGENQ